MTDAPENEVIPPKKSLKKIPPKKFQSALLAWFSVVKKDYPWRRTRDPWAILVSEIMLQQTTVAMVIGQSRFEKFLATFPDLLSIAEASEESLLLAWEGLGYYNRVRNLQKTARVILAEHDGIFPENLAELKKLPGIGPYTAGAVFSFAFNQPAPIVDGNIARVLSRIHDDSTPIDSSAGQKLLWSRAENLLSKKEPRAFNSALMELGQSLCTPRQPDCPSCPVRALCQAKNPENLPKKKPRPQTIFVEEHALLVVSKNQILLAASQNQRRQGLYHLPLREVGELAHLQALTPPSKYAITKHRVTLSLYPCTPQHIPRGIQNDEQFFPLEKLPELPLPSPIRRALETHL